MKWVNQNRGRDGGLGGMSYAYTAVDSDRPKRSIETTLKLELGGNTRRGEQE